MILYNREVVELNKTNFDNQIEQLLYYRKGLLSVKEYFDITSNDNIVEIKYNSNNNNFCIKTDSGNNFEFKVYKMEKE